MKAEKARNTHRQSAHAKREMTMESNFRISTSSVYSFLKTPPPTPTEL